MNNTVYETPHLALPGLVPLHALEKKILSKAHHIEEWFHTQWQQQKPPLYGSVDLRNSGFKLAPVDMNLFPAGFNNLNPDFLPLSIEAAKTTILEWVRDAKKVLLIPENHTRNVFYWENVDSIQHILQKAGFEVVIGSFDADLQETKTIQLQNNKTLDLHPVTREGNKLKVKAFIPDVIVLNNDLSNDVPALLQDLEQPILPPARLGWNHRSKTKHFFYYEKICEEFSKVAEIDPWWIAPYYDFCDDVDFMNRTGEDSIYDKAKTIFQKIQKKYDEYKITCEPFIVIKADAGTYGMAVMMIKNPEEIRTLNRKQRTNMSKSKGGQSVSRVIIQEGVYTFEKWDNSVAEPVVYLWGERVVGGFYRVHKEKGIDENLNAPGMHFESLAFAKTCNKPQQNESDECQNRFYAYGVISRLSMLAAAKEMEHLYD